MVKGRKLEISRLTHNPNSANESTRYFDLSSRLASSGWLLLASCGSWFDRFISVEIPSWAMQRSDLKPLGAFWRH